MHTHADWLHLARRAIASGATAPRPWLIEWDASSGCENPHTVTIEGRQRPLDWRHGLLDGPAYRLELSKPTAFLDIEVPCRKCRTCLRKRAGHWRHRMTNELRHAQRTWFGSLTFKPDEHSRMAMEVTKRIGFGAFAQLSPAGELAERHVEGGRRITKWLKRIRAASGASLRYCLVLEPHKSGLPHYHILVHEVTLEGVTWRELSRQWRAHGFSNFQLTDDPVQAARYLTKYLTKSSLARVRASVGYGHRELSPSGQTGPKGTE